MFRRSTLLFTSFLFLFGLLFGLTQAVGIDALAEFNQSTRSAADGELTLSDIERAASKMDEALLSQLRSDPDLPVTAIVHMGGQIDLTPIFGVQSRDARSRFIYSALQVKAARSQRNIRAYLDAEMGSGSVSGYRPYFIFNGLAVTAQSQALYQIALRDDVESLTVNHIYHLDDSVPILNPSSDLQSLIFDQSPEWNITIIGADRVWNEYDVTGAGVVVANLDSGVQYDHPALLQQYAGHLDDGSFNHDYNWFDATLAANPAPYDDNGHGTHTMGSIGGGDGSRPSTDAIGVAPGASWIAVKAFTGGGTATSDAIHAAFEWLIAPCPVGVPTGSSGCDPTRAPAIVNNSWGSSDGSRIEFLPDVQALRAAGIVPVFSAGNSGPGDGTVGAPGSFSEAFAVGATDSADQLASFSSRGPSPLTDEVKPDVSAPGVAIRSSIPGNNYASYQGTSMAAPHVAGLAALMLSGDPALDVDTLEELIRLTAVDLGPTGPDSRFGYGRIDAFRAVGAVVDSGALTGRVQDAVSQDTLVGVSLLIEGEGIVISASTDSTGRFSAPYLPAGEYVVSAATYGYETAVSSAIAIIADESTSIEIDMTPLPRFTVTGQVYGGGDLFEPIEGVTITALDVPLLPVYSDANGRYTLTVASGPLALEAAAFGFATQYESATVNTNTSIDFYLDPLPPILLVDDDQGHRSYSPQVEEHYFAALDANGYSYDHWDLGQRPAPDYEIIRQYAAVIWFGGEFGRIKDISEAEQAQALMDYLDIGGRLLYISQSHTWYYGDDKQCNSPINGGAGPCPFTEDYLGVADWTEDQLARVNFGVDGDPVGNGLGPLPMVYPPFFFDFSDDIVGAVQASLAFTATNEPDEINRTGYTLEERSSGFKTVFMATPIEAMSTSDAADVVEAVMDWFGVQGLPEGLTLAPSTQSGMALPGDDIVFPLRLKNLNSFPDQYSLELLAAPWPTEIRDETGSTVNDPIGPIAANDSADFQVLVHVPDGVKPGQEETVLVRATSLSGTPFQVTAQLLAQAQMAYYAQDSDQCGGGVQYGWVDASMGKKWNLDDSGSTPEPEFISVTLPAPFTFYNQVYEHLWINDHGTILFGDDNLYDDDSPSGVPPIPNPTILDPNNAIYMGWGNYYWHPSSQPPETGVYTLHDTENSVNRFVVEYHQYPNLLGSGRDTFQAVLDLDNNDIIVQYKTITHHESTVVGIENEIGTEGVLYVDEQEPVENMLHDSLAIHFGVGKPPRNLQFVLLPPIVNEMASQGQVISHTLTLSNTSNFSETFGVEANGAVWPTSIVDPTGQAITSVGPLAPCTAQDFLLRVEVPQQLTGSDTTTVRVRSQSNPLRTSSSTLTTKLHYEGEIHLLYLPTMLRVP